MEIWECRICGKKSCHKANKGGCDSCINHDCQKNKKADVYYICGSICQTKHENKKER